MTPDELTQNGINQIKRRLDFLDGNHLIELGEIKTTINCKNYQDKTRHEVFIHIGGKIAVIFKDETNELTKDNIDETVENVVNQLLLFLVKDTLIKSYKECHQQ